MMKDGNLFSHKAGSVLLALVVCALWGSLYPFVKLGYSAFEIASNDIPTIILFAGIRFAVSGLILIAALCISAGKVALPEKSSLMPIVLVALATIILHYSFTYIGLSLGEGSKSAIVKQVGFLFLSCFAFLFVKEDRFSPAKLISGILGFAGIIVTSMDGTGFSFKAGDLMLILASFCSVAGIVLSKRATRKINPVQLVAYSQFLGGVFLCVIGLLMGGKITHIDTNSILVFGYICFASIVAYSLWNVLLKYNDLSKLSIIKFTEPLFAVIFSGILLGENIFKLSYLVALVIIFAAILLSNLKLNKAGSKEVS